MTAHKFPQFHSILQNTCNILIIWTNAHLHCPTKCEKWATVKWHKIRINIWQCRHKKLSKKCKIVCQILFPRHCLHEQHFNSSRWIPLFGAIRQHYPGKRAHSSSSIFSTWQIYLVKVYIHQSSQYLATGHWGVLERLAGRHWPAHEKFTKIVYIISFFLFFLFYWIQEIMMFRVQFMNISLMW